MHKKRGIIFSVKNYGSKITNRADKDPFQVNVASLQKVLISVLNPWTCVSVNNIGDNRIWSWEVITAVSSVFSFQFAYWECPLLWDHKESWKGSLKWNVFKGYFKYQHVFGERN